MKAWVDIGVVIGLGVVMAGAGCRSASPGGGGGSSAAREPAGRVGSGAGVADVGAGREGGFEAPVVLEDYLRVAALRNPGLEAAFLKWKAALDRVPQAGGLPDPRFTFGYYIREVETRVGPQNERYGIAQTFPWFGKLALREDRAWEAARAEQARYDAVKLRLFHDVRSLYCEYYYLARAIRVTGENMELLKRLEGVAQARFRAGADVGSVVKAQAEIGRLEDQLATLQDLRGPMMARLNAVMDLPPGTVLPWPEVLAERELGLPDETLLAWLDGGSPELELLEAEVRGAEHAVALARRDFYPDVTFGVDYVRTGDALDPRMADSGKDPVMAMLSFNVPLGGKYRAALREAEHRRSAARLEVVDRRNVLEARLKMALHGFRDAGRKAALYRDTLAPLARTSLGVAQQAYEAGKADFLELVDAERLLLEFELGHARARADREIRLSEIEMLLGRDLGGSSVALDGDWKGDD